MESRPGSLRWRQVLRAGRVLAASILAVSGLAAPRSALAHDPISPGVPVPVSPASGATSAENAVLRWAPAARALLYEVKTEPKINGATCSGQTLSLSFVCEELPPGTYTWSVRAIGLHGVNGDFSAPRTFVKLARLSTAPTVLAPATGATFQYPDEPSLLGWSAVSTAAGYQVQISTDPAFPGSLQPSYGGGPILLDASPTATSALAPATDFGEIGRASCRERV